MNNQRRRSATFNDMPYEILLKIFMCLNIVDLVICVSSVSKSWREVCCDPKLWTVFDLDVSNSDLFRGRKNPLIGLDQAAKTVQIRYLGRALRLSGGVVNTLIFSSVIFLRNGNLLYIAQRTPNLKELIILCSWDLLDMFGFAKAVMYWLELESLKIPCFYYPRDIIRVISHACDKFRALKLRCPLDLEFAQSIVVDAPQLKSLSIQYIVYYNDGLAHLLKHSKNLEVLDLSHSLLVDHLYRGDYSDFDSREIQGKIVKSASQLKSLITCEPLFSKLPCNCPYNDFDFQS